MKDITLDFELKGSTAPVASTSTKTGSAVDIRGCQALKANVHVGAITTLNATDKFTLTVETGDNAALTDAAAVDSGDYIGPNGNADDIWDRILDADAVANTIYSVGIKNTAGKSYARVILTAAASPSVVVGTFFILGHNRHNTPPV